MKRSISAVAVAGAFFVLIFASESVLAYSRGGIALCAELIIPSIFPFSVIYNILIRLRIPQTVTKHTRFLSNKLFRVSDAGASAFIMGLCGGYPLGCAYIKGLYDEKQISLSESEKLLAFCSNSGPAFIIGAIGAGAFSSVRAGVTLYLCHAAAALLTGLIFRNKACDMLTAKANERTESPLFSTVLTNAVREAAFAVIPICGFIIIFSVFTGLLCDWGVFYAISHSLPEADAFNGLLAGLIELGTGAGYLKTAGLSVKSFVFAAVISGFGGVSVYFQTAAIISDSKIQGTLYLKGRLVCAAISGLLALAAAPIAV